MSAFSEWVIAKVSHWLLKNDPPRRAYLCDFKKISKEIVPGDVLLIEGRNRVSRVIQQITHSPWSHATLYVGKLNTIKNEELKSKIQALGSWPEDMPFIIESEVGEGTIISPLTKYDKDHIRILRPQGLNKKYINKVINYAVSRLGKRYNLRHVFDLARFLFPWSLFPRRYRSTLFQHNAQQPTEDMCSSMIADAFHSIQFPILPLVKLNKKKNIELVQRNPRLFTPSDFDYSPYFNVIKYPIFKLGKDFKLEDLPWKRDEISDDR